MPKPATDLPTVADPFTTETAAELYDVEAWGDGYFSINTDGNVCVHPTRESEKHIDLRRLVDEAVERGIPLPLLLRFTDILEDRVHRIQGAFETARAEHDYRGDYCTVYPIKVNQQRHVVQTVQRVGEPLGVGFGLEVGSKAELLAVLAIADNKTPILCNGFKDAEYIETVLLAQKVGRRITTIVERKVEIDLILRYAERHGIRPSVGVRVKLATSGAGRWRDSAGYRSKFGLTAAETLEVLATLEKRAMADCLELLHYHMGSQITDIRQIKAAVSEGARIYTELVKAGAGLRFLDVGGGLGVDYDGSQSNTESSINYSLQEYANDVVWAIQTICDEQNVTHPTIITECGRALTAHHSLLVFEVVGLSSMPWVDVPVSLPEDSPQPLLDLFEAHRGVTLDNAVEYYHDAETSLEEALTLFRLGHLSIIERAAAESLFFATCRKVYDMADQMEYVPDEIEHLRSLVARQYFSNFSLFQSVPDSWAIDQLFPIMPLQRLDEEPTMHGVLADVSCDSDGRIDRFIDRRGTQPTLRLHDLSVSDDDESYLIGVFLVGAYQEILGDLHNLFGDTNAVHIRYDDDLGAVFEDVVEGDRVREVLDYVQFDSAVLLRRFRRDVEAAVREGRVTAIESGQLLRFYEAGLQGYTYLEPALD